MTKAPQNDVARGSIQTGDAVLHGLALSIWCVISFELITHLPVHIYSISRDDDLLGGMWAVVATIFVYRYSRAQSLNAALSRTAATLLSFALCLAYLLIFPFHVLGMAALIGIGAVVMTLIGRPDDIITTGITTAVVMVVAGVSLHQVWLQPILRLIDTLVGIGVGVVASWVNLKVTSSFRARADLIVE
jgi:uncharacterized membrane protein YccC